MRNSVNVQNRDETLNKGAQGWSETRAFLLGNGPEIRLVPGETAVIPEHDGWSRLLVHLDYLTDPTELGQSTLQIIATMLGAYSAAYVTNMNTVVRRAFQNGIFNLSRTIVLKDILNWADSSNSLHWPLLKFYLTRLSAIGSKELVSQEVKQFLKTPEKFEKRDGGSYVPLVVNDPDRGALTEQEVDSVCRGLNAALNEGRLSMFRYTVTWFFMTTGIRPIQMARMKIGDVRITTAEDGREEVILRIPYGKGIQGGKTEYSSRPAPSALSGILIRYLAENASKDPNAPLFFRNNSLPSHFIERVSNRINAFSARTGGRIKLTPYRFRYTIATRAIARGASDADVAWLLMHSNTGSIKYYRASMADLQAPIEQILGGGMNFLAAHFEGRIIDAPEDDADLIRDFSDLGGRILGICGSTVECWQNAPRACLGCWKFQPLVDAPWDQMESVLEGELSGQPTSDAKSIVNGQLDRVRGIRAACDAKKLGEREESK